jgi:D-alanyl-D-alanine carboxypeptidase/D-alanyl-D-alanine-endopeptidase (penicillin-binding protein 4)
MQHCFEIAKEAKNVPTATTSFQHQFLIRALLLLALMLLFTSCAEGEKQTGAGSTESQDSKKASNNGEAASTDSVPSEVSDAIEQVTSEPRYEHSSWGFSVRDLSTGEVLLEQSSDKMFVPGSIFKTFSGATVLDGYGPDYRFRTPVYRTDALNQGVLEGDLVLVASGDLSLGLREQPDGTMAFANAPEFDHTYANVAPQTGLVGDPLAGLNELAQQARDAGLREVRGDVVIDDRLFKPWESPDGLISPIMVNENRIDITTKPTSSGDAAKVHWRPKTAAYTLKNEVKTVAEDGETNLEVDQPEPGVIRISGQIAAGSDPAIRVGEVEDPAAFARTAFIEALERAGIEVSATPTGSNPSDLLPSEDTYRESERVAQHVSAPLEEFTAVIFKTSHNPGAQLMTCLSAVKAGSRDCEDGLKQEFEVFTGLGVPAQSTFIFDGAGSDDHNRTTPDAMTEFLRAVDEQSYGEAFRSSLAIVGEEGTQAEALKDSPAVGKIRVKDGTRVIPTPAGQGIVLGKTLVGYVEAESGRRLVISIMVGNVPVASAQEIFPVVESVTNDQGELAAEIQQRY